MNPLLQITGFLRPLALTLMLLMATTALPIPESLGDGIPRDDVSRKSVSRILNSSMDLAVSLQMIASKLKTQMCDTYNLCDNSNEALAENNLVFPSLTEGDGCLSSGFNEETCLIKIVDGLQKFNPYLQFMGEEIKNNGDEKFPIKNTVNLTDKLKLLIKRADAVPTPDPIASEKLLSELQSLKGWPKNVVLRLILWHYNSFMEGTVRAVRYLNNRSLHA